MKKNISMILIGAMVVLAGCGSAKDNTSVDVADAIYEEASNAIDEVTDSATEAIDEIADEVTATTADIEEPEHTPMDITDCYTFTDIVNKLQVGQGYTNATIDDTDVLIVTDYAYDYDGNDEFVSIEGDIYRYNGDQIEYLGYVCSSGTSYPFMICDGKLYTAGNHYVKSYGINEEGLQTVSEVWVNYNEEGEASYFKLDNGEDVAIDETDDVAAHMYDYLDNGEMIKFDVIQ